MARSINLALSCVAMLAAALLAYVVQPHRLMARTHDVFDIDAHVPHAFGDWSPLPGVEAVRPPPDGLEAKPVKGMLHAWSVCSCEASMRSPV